MSDGFIGSGDLFGERIVDGVSGGMLPLGNAQKFELKENNDTKTRQSKNKATYGSALNTVVLKRPGDISIMLDGLDHSNLALVFMGDSADLSVAAGSVANELQTAGVPGSMVALNNREVSNVQIVGRTLGTDYIVDPVLAKLGFITIVEGGAIAAGDVLDISYDNAAIQGKRISGGTKPNVRMRLVLCGKNLVNDQKVVVDVADAVITPQSGVDFLSEDFTTLDMSGTVNIPEGGTTAYTVDLVD